MGTRRAGGFILVLGVLLAAGAATAPRVSAGGVTLTLTASPNPALPNQLVTYTGTLTPTADPPDSVTVTMGFRVPCYGPCNQSWTLTAPITPQTFTVEGYPGQQVTFAVTSCGPEPCGGPTATITVPIVHPKATGSLSYSPTGVVMPGDTLHFTVSGSVTLMAVQVDLQTLFPETGLSEPTNMSAGAMWAPSPQHYIDYNTTLDRSGSYSFDATVTAALGTDVPISVIIYDSLGGILSNSGVKATYKIHVGPRPTAPPGSAGAPGASPSASESPTPSPTPTATETASLLPSEPFDSGSPGASETASASPADENGGSQPSTPDLPLPPLLIGGGIAAAGIAGGGWLILRHLLTPKP